MIKLIIHCADIHIRNYRRLDEYSNQLSNFIEKCKELAQPYQKDEVRIVIAGDIVHSKNTVSNELFAFASAFIRQLEEIAKVIIIAGNHDLSVTNLSRKDTITALFETANFQNSVFADGVLGFDSGTIVDDNVIWVLYSIYSDYRIPDISSIKESNANNTVIGLFHGTVVGSVSPNGIVMQEGTDGNMFSDCDIVMAGHIHKRQELKRGNTTIVYPSSLIQQTFGETITQHGFYVWDIENKKHQFIEFPSEYGLYEFKIKNENDITNDKEMLINY